MTRVRGSLVGPWVISGLVGAYLYVEAFGLLHDRDMPPFLILLLVATPVVAGIFGWILTQHAQKRAVGGFSVALAFGVTFVAGLSNGVIVGGIGGLFSDFPTGFIWGTIGGGIFGVICSIPFLAPLSLSARLANARGRAREGTLVDRSDARFAWAALPPCAALGTLLVELASSSWQHPSALTILVAGLGAAVAFALFLFDLAAWRRAIAESKKADDGSSSVYDVGVGEETVARTELSKTAYRDVDRDVRVLRGSPIQAARELRERAFIGFVTTGIAVAGAIGVSAIQDGWSSFESKTPTTALERPPPPPEAIRVLYSRPETVDRVELLGTRLATKTAYVRVESGSSTQVRAVDWDKHSELTVWQPRRDDRDTWLTIARAPDPNIAHPDGLPIVDSFSNTSYAWLDENAQLHAIGLDGKSRAVSTGRASDVAFEPNGTRFVFISSGKLYVVDAAAGSPATPIDLKTPRSPVFATESDDRVFVVANECVHQVNLRLGKDQGAILCPGLRELVMIGDSRRDTAAVCGKKDSGSMCTWIDLPSGAVKGRVTSDRPIDPITLGPNGLLVARAGEGMAYVSLKDQGQFRFDDQPDTSIDARAGRWLDDVGTLLALRHTTGEWEVVEIDVDRMIDGSARPLP